MTIHHRRLAEIADEARPGGDPPYVYPDYRSTVRRGPTRPLLILPGSLSETTGPVFGDGDLDELDNDLTRQHEGEPLGERIVVTGRITDDRSHPLRQTLVEVWQANAAGRYRHVVDQHPAPLDPNFTGCGRCLTDDDGRYRFVTVKPGAYPWGNHPNAWRPQHIHFSIFGRAFTERLVTQMYFPGDPLLDYDPIYQSVRDANDRKLLISSFDWETTTPDWALGYRFDVVVGGRRATPLDTE